MKFATAMVEGLRTLVMERDGDLHRPIGALARLTVDDIVRDVDAAFAALDRCEREPVRWEQVSLTRPAVSRPGKILGAGANFHDHIAEMKLPAPSDRTPPFLFQKPTTSLVGDGAVVRTDIRPEVKLDYEVELGVVIGKAAERVARRDAWEHIAGYVVANDVSARGPFRVADPAGPAFAFDWLAHKGQDGFCPVGPWFVPASELPDAGAVRLRTWVNGEVRQDGTTADIISSPERLIEFASSYTTLEPGDLLLTGTPAGVGAGSGRFLRDGDVVRVEASGVGAVTTTFRDRAS